MMKNRHFDDYEIELKLSEMEDSQDWEPITLKELMSFTQSELDELKSYCWHDGKPRCSCIGIKNLTVTGPSEKGYYTIEFSDSDGDPNFQIHKDSKIDNAGDGEWNYGLYKKITK